MISFFMGLLVAVFLFALASKCNGGLPAASWWHVAFFGIAVAFVAVHIKY